MTVPVKLSHFLHTTARATQPSIAAVAAPIFLPSLLATNNLTHTWRYVRTRCGRFELSRTRGPLLQKRNLSTTSQLRGPAAAVAHEEGDTGLSASQNDISAPAQGNSQTHTSHEPKTGPGTIPPFLFRQKSRAKPVPERRVDARTGLSTKEMMFKIDLDGKPKAKTTPAYSPSTMQESRSSDASKKRDSMSLFGADAQQFDIESSAPAFRISPALGKTVVVDQNRNMDLGRAFRSVEIRCSNNQIRRDLREQKFHERPGLKRKRLKRERWAGRFKADFVKTVRRVEQLRHMGW